MASTISKRQQARNERALQELIKAVAGNDRCADCSSKNPGGLAPRLDAPYSQARLLTIAFSLRRLGKLECERFSSASSPLDDAHC